MSVDVHRVFVIGMGEVGRRLAGCLGRAGMEIVPVTRELGWEEARSAAPGLRLVCVREEALADVVATLDRVAPHDLAFVQNGWVRPLLDPLGEVTRGLIWFTSKGEFFKALRPSPFAGPAAPALAAALTAGGLPSSVATAAEFAALDAEKMGFNCVVGLPLAVHGVSLGEYLDQFRDEARALFAESVEVCGRAAGVAASPEWWPAFLTAAAPLAWVRSVTAKALEFRNGAVLGLAREQGVAVPVTERLLGAVASVARG